MDVSVYHFLRLKQFLNDPIVCISEFYFTPDSEVFGSRNDNGAFELPSFNGCYAGWVTASMFDDIVVNICQEIDQNVAEPIAESFKTNYLSEVQSFCEKKLEGIILKEVNGNWEYDLNFVKYDGTSFDELGKCEEYREYFKTTKFIFDSLRYIVVLVQEHTRSLLSSSTMKVNRKPRKELDSFILRDSLRLSNEVMKDLKDEMVDAKFISPTTGIDDFRAVFENRPINTKIVWVGDKGALKLFISRLQDECFSSKVSDVWKITSKCFTFSDGKSLTNTDFHSIHKPETDTENAKRIFGLIRKIKNVKPHST